MENKEKGSCSCKSNGSMLLACSGACDLGQITDLVARKLRDEGKSKMHCLAIVGAGVSEPIEAIKKNCIIMLDGCSIDCGKKILDKANFPDYKYIRISDLGYKKGQTPVTKGVINEVCKKVEAIL